MKAFGIKYSLNLFTVKLGFLIRYWYFFLLKQNVPIPLNTTLTSMINLILLQNLKKNLYLKILRLLKK